MKFQLVNDEGRVIDIVPGMRIVLCQLERQTPYIVSFLTPDGSLIASAEYYEYISEGAIHPHDTGHINNMFDIFIRGVLSLSGFSWRKDFWNWKEEVSAQLQAKVRYGFIVVEKVA